MRFSQFLVLAIAAVGATAVVLPDAANGAAANHIMVRSKPPKQTQAPATKGTPKPPKTTPKPSAPKPTPTAGQSKTKKPLKRPNDTCSPDACNRNSDCDEALGCNCVMGWCRDP